jgi:hypothetical protein
MSILSRKFRFWGPIIGINYWRKSMRINYQIFWEEKQNANWEGILDLGILRVKNCMA